MAEERTYHVTVRLDRGFEFVAEFPDVPGAPRLHFDEPAPLGADRAPNAVAVLSAAVGNCLAASLAFCLRRSRIDVEGLTANVTTRVARDEKGRHRIAAIDVELAPVLGRDARLEGNLPRMDRCGDLFEDFCTVTASVKHGIPVRVSLKPGATTKVA
jgi:uncharacterized OsmC-like protein